MAINKKFAKLVNGNLVYAENPIMYEGKLIVNPSATICRKLGFKNLIDNKLPEKEGYAIQKNGYSETESTIYVKYKYVEVEKPDVKPVRIFSKLYLKIALMKMGLWDRVSFWMENNEIDLGDGVKLNCLEAFETALTLSDKFEGFPLIVKALQNYLEISDEQVEVILKSAETDQ